MTGGRVPDPDVGTVEAEGNGLLRGHRLPQAAGDGRGQATSLRAAATAGKVTVKRVYFPGRVLTPILPPRP